MSFDLDWPTWGWVADVRPLLAEAVAQGRPAVLATLYATVGASPRPPGSQMLFVGDRAAGFLSGGCVEGDLALRAAEVLADGTPLRLVYGEGSPFFDIRLLCGGRIEVLLERLQPDDPAVADLLRARDDRRRALWTTDGETRSCRSAVLDDAELTATADPFSLIRRHDPPWRLVVAGGDPTALAIASLGARSGLETTLLRPQGPLEPPPIPGLHYSRAPADDFLKMLGLDAWTAVAAASHDLELDEAVLAPALLSEAAYVGALGSARRLQERLARLRAAGVPEAALARLRAPIGLSLGGKAPWEIAVAVIGEVVATVHARRPAQ